MRSSPDIDDIVSNDATVEKTSLKDKQDFNIKRVCLCLYYNLCLSRILFFFYLSSFYFFFSQLDEC